MIAHLSKLGKEGIANIRQVKPLMWLLLIIAGALAFLAPVGLAAKAMLYLIADNGKKSGRASGNVYMRNGRVRGFVVPALVQNAYTTAARALLAQLSQGWSALTDANRLTWDSITWLFKSDRFGNPKLVKGKAAYVMLNANLVNVAQSPIADAPVASDGVAGVESVTVTPDQSTGELNIGFSPTPTTAGITHLLFATAPFSAGVSRPSASRFRLIDTILPATATPYDAASAYTTKFGSAWKDNAGYVGAKIGILLKPINIITGVEGGNIMAIGTIQA